MIFENPFLVMAIIAGCLASIASGIVGSYVVVKRIVFISGSIAHSVLGGMGFFLWLQRSHNISFATPLRGALFAAIISAVLMGWIHLKHRQREDTVIASIWAIGMSLGVIFTSLTPGYNVELMNFLFGNILWTSGKDILSLGFLNLIIVAFVVPLHKKFLAICFDEKQAELQGLNVKLLYIVLLCLVAISTVLLVQVIGSVLVIAMLAIPPAIASNFFHKLSLIMFASCFLGIIFTFLGTLFSYFLNWPPGASIALTTTFFYVATLAFLKK